jgi:hypothetical protein
MSSTVVRVALAVAIGANALPLRARHDDAQQLIALAREALGGEARLMAVKSETRETKSFKFNVEIPDKTFRPPGH